MLINRFWYRNH